jgi:hypothetical protein
MCSLSFKFMSITSKHCCVKKLGGSQDIWGWKTKRKSPKFPTGNRNSVVTLSELYDLRKWKKQQHTNKELREELINFLRYDTDRIQNDKSSNPSIVVYSSCHGNIFTEPLPRKNRGGTH